MKECFKKLKTTFKEEFEKVFSREYLKQLFSRQGFKELTIFLFALGVIFSFFQINAIIAEDLQWGGRFNPYTSLQMYLSDLLFALSLLSYGCYVLFNSKRVFFTLGKQYSKLALFGIIFFALVSYFVSINQAATFFWLVQVIKLSLIYLMIINRFISEKKLILIILWSLVLQSVIGLGQFISQSSLGLTFLGESLIGPDVLNVAKIDVGSSVIVRPYGTFTHANIFGGLQSLGLLLAGYLTITRRIHPQCGKFFITMCAVGTLLSFSRSAWLATLLSILLLLAFRKFKIRYANIRKSLLTLIGAVLALSMTGILNLILVRLSFADASIASRLAQIKSSFLMMLHHPFGVGMGNYTNAASSFNTEKLLPWEFEPVHNIFLLVGTELGIIAMILFIYALIRIILSLFKRLKGLEGKHRCYPIYFGIILFAHLIILANLDHYFYTNYSATIFLIATLAITKNYLSKDESGVSLK